LARRLREALEDQFDAGYQPYLSLLGELRPIVQERIPESARRKALWIALLDSEILDLLRQDAHQAARQRAFEIVDALS
jgi:siroheme synthase (precorrin-2 oxidase/ferrochelatase)